MHSMATHRNTARGPRATWATGIALVLTACQSGLAEGGAAAASADGFALRETPGSSIDVLYRGRTVARYMFAYDPSTPERLHETYKPYLHVFDAEGKRPITKGAGGRYTHHRGIFLGWNRLTCDGKQYDLWHMKGVAQVHQEFLKKDAGSTGATLTSLVHWNDSAGKPLIREERTMAFRPVPAPAIVEVELSLRLVAEQDLRLDGDPEHGGIQYRPADEVDPKKTAYVFPKTDADPRKDTDYRWVGATYSLGEKRYSVVHMNHPENPKGTVYSAYRDYGRFGAFFKKDLAAGEPLALRYRFLVMEGELPPSVEVEARWRQAHGDAAGAR